MGKSSFKSFPSVDSINILLKTLLNLDKTYKHRFPNQDSFLCICI